MPDVPESKLRVFLEAQGREVRGVVRWDLDSDFLTSTDAFSFETYSETPEFGLELQPVRLELNGAPQLVGRIDTSVMGENGRAISYRGRDYIADLVECRIDPSFEVKEGEDLGRALLKAAGPVGITTIRDDIEGTTPRDVRLGKKANAKKGKKFSSKKEEDRKPQFGQGIYDFCNRVVARHGATIQPTLDRSELWLCSPNYSQSPSYRIVRIDGDPRNNVKRATATRDFSSVPSHTMFNGSQVRVAYPTVTLNTVMDLMDPNRPFFSAAFGVNPIINVQAPREKSRVLPTIEGEAKQLSLQLADTIERGTVKGRRKADAGPLPNGLLYRLLAHRDTEAKSQAQLEATAVRAISERLKETLSYQVTVHGHIDPVTGAAWSIDTIATVEDYVCNIFEPMWIAKRTFRFDANGGAETEMTLWRPGTLLPHDGLE